MLIREASCTKCPELDICQVLSINSLAMILLKLQENDTKIDVISSSKLKSRNGAIISDLLYLPHLYCLGFLYNAHVLHMSFIF